MPVSVSAFTFYIFFWLNIDVLPIICLNSILLIIKKFLKLCIRAYFIFIPFSIMIKSFPVTYSSRYFEAAITRLGHFKGTKILDHFLAGLIPLLCTYA